MFLIKIFRCPFYKYSFCSFSNILSSWFQYEALKFVSFPTQVLAKGTVSYMLLTRWRSRPSASILNHKSDRFIYLNDDFFMLRPICPSDFISEKDELLIYLKDLNHITEYAKKKKYDWKCNCDATLLG